MNNFSTFQTIFKQLITLDGSGMDKNHLIFAISGEHEIAENWTLSSEFGDWECRFTKITF